MKKNIAIILCTIILTVAISCDPTDVSEQPHNLLTETKSEDTLDVIEIVIDTEETEFCGLETAELTETESTDNIDCVTIIDSETLYEEDTEEDERGFS